MTFRTYYLFYIVASVLLIAGLLTQDESILAESGPSNILNSYLGFFIPASIGAFLFGILYHYLLKRGRHVQKLIVVLHFLLMTFGLLFSMSFYALSVLFLSSSGPDTAALSFGDNSLFFVALGPILLILSLFIFAIGLLKAKRTVT